MKVSCRLYFNFNSNYELLSFCVSLTFDKIQYTLIKCLLKEEHKYLSLEINSRYFNYDYSYYFINYHFLVSLLNATDVVIAVIISDNIMVFTNSDN